MPIVLPSLNYTDESRRFQQALLDGEPGTDNGGLYADKPGYHNKRVNLLATDYSVRTPVDKLGPSNKSAGHDWTFPGAQRGDYTRISLYTRRVEAAFWARDPRLKGWREYLGCIDGVTIGFDFDSWQTRKPDSTHKWHGHFSEHRAFVESWQNKVNMLGVLGLIEEVDDDMFCKLGDKGNGKVWVLQRELNRLGVGTPITEDDSYGPGTAAKMVELGMAGISGKGNDYGPGEYDTLQQRLRELAGGGAPGPQGPAGPPGPKGDKGDVAVVHDGSLLRVVTAPADTG